jgi:hypothetical protein
MSLEFEVIDLVFNYINIRSIENQIRNIKSICFRNRVNHFEKIYRPVNPETNYLFSENDGRRLIFAKFKNKNVMEKRLYKYRCKPLMIQYVEQFEFDIAETDEEDEAIADINIYIDKELFIVACQAEELYFDI